MGGVTNEGGCSVKQGKEAKQSVAQQSIVQHSTANTAQHGHGNDKARQAVLSMTATAAATVQQVAEPSPSVLLCLGSHEKHICLCTGIHSCSCSHHYGYSYSYNCNSIHALLQTDAHCRVVSLGMDML